MMSMRLTLATWRRVSQSSLGALSFLDAIDLVFDLFVGCWPSLLQFGSLCPLFAVLSEPLMECDIYHLPWWFAFVSLTLSVLRVSGHVYAASACLAVFHNAEGDCILCLFLSCILNAVYRRSREHGGLYYQ